MTLDEFNALTPAAAEAALLTCCAAPGWASSVAAGRPYPTTAALAEAAGVRWARATEAEILEAFEAHPVIGDPEVLRSKFAGGPAAEQGQVAAADDATLLALARRNVEYKARHGFIFIVFASGKSAREMLDLLEARLGNSRHEELMLGAAEQGKIMQQRLHQLTGA